MGYKDVACDPDDRCYKEGTDVDYEYVLTEAIALEKV